MSDNGACTKHENIMKLLRRYKILAGTILLLGGLGLTLCFLFQRPVDELNRAQFLFLLNKKAITTASLTPSPYTGIYLVEGSYGAAAKFTITTHLDAGQVAQLLGVPAAKVATAAGGASRAQIVNIICTLLIASLIVAVVVHQGRIGKGKGTHRVRERPEVRFEDVAGIEEAKAEVQEIVDFLRNPRKYKRLGGKLPKGVLLIGPPGTGKTMLAKAIAGEAKASFFSAHGSDFNEVFVGVGAKRIREIFRQAARSKPAIIFIDEIDCLGKNRKYDTHGELQQTNNALLAAMDGFESNDGIVVIAATNRPEDLDEALMRPGRFDRKVNVPYPDMKGRRAILETHSRNKPLENPSRALDVIAQTTPGMSGADLANLVNEAAILCAQQNLGAIGLTELEAARDKVRFGKERRSMVLKATEREMVAYHEAGHAIINLHMKRLPPLYKVSIIPRGNALGVTTLLPNEDQNIHSKDFLLEQLVVLMGGRAAEKVFYGATTNGAAGDLDSARKLAQRMIHEWGMGEKLYYEPEQRDAEIEINRLLQESDHQALQMIESLKKQTQCLAEALLERETLDREEVLHLLRKSAPENGFEMSEEYFPV